MDWLILNKRKEERKKKIAALVVVLVVLQCRDEMDADDMAEEWVKNNMSTVNKWIN